MTTTAGQAALASVDLVIARGADNPFKFRYQTSDGATPPTVTNVNLTGWSARAQIRDSYGGTVWISLTSPTGIALTSDGYISFTVPSASTTDPVWDRRSLGVWDLELVDVSGNVIRFVSGRVTVSQDVTR